MRKFLWVAVAAAAGLASAAQANIVPVMTGITAEGGLFRYNYSVTLDTDQGLMPGSRLSIFDFAGFAGGLTSSSASFVAGTELFTTGLLTPPSFTDDPAVTNLTLTWVGAPYHTSGGPFTETNFTLSALSTFSSWRSDGYTAEAVKNNGLTTGLVTDNVGPVVVPFGAAVPEPASWALLIVGFGGVGSLLRARRSAPRPVTA